MSFIKISSIHALCKGVSRSSSVSSNIGLADEYLSIFIYQKIKIKIASITCFCKNVSKSLRSIDNLLSYLRAKGIFSKLNSQKRFTFPNHHLWNTLDLNMSFIINCKCTIRRSTVRVLVVYIN